MILDEKIKKLDAFLSLYQESNFVSLENHCGDTEYFCYEEGSIANMLTKICLLLINDFLLSMGDAGISDWDFGDNIWDTLYYFQIMSSESTSKNWDITIGTLNGLEDIYFDYDDDNNLEFTSDQEEMCKILFYNELSAGFKHLSDKEVDFVLNTIMDSLFSAGFQFSAELFEPEFLLYSSITVSKLVPHYSRFIKEHPELSTLDDAVRVSQLISHDVDPFYAWGYADDFYSADLYISYAIWGGCNDCISFIDNSPFVLKLEQRLICDLIDLYIVKLDREYHFLPKELQDAADHIFPNFQPDVKQERKAS